MRDDIIITIGLCVRNAEATVGRAIDSILNQDFPRKHMELVVVDGCSTDSTLNIIKDKLRGSNLKTRIFRENKGLGYARQLVVNNASGEYILWVDADMILPKDFAKKQVLFMERSPKVGIAKGRYGICMKDNLVAMLEDVEFAISFRSEGEANLPALGTSGCIYRVEAVKQAGGFDPDMRGVGEDQDIESRVKAAGWLLHISPAVFYERRRETWKSLWDEYFWHGVGAAHLFSKNKRAVKIFKMLPPVALFTEFLRVPLAYKLTGRFAVLLLPFHYVFKRVAWMMGFVRGKLLIFWSS
ncbi:MAG: glycosyltransferase [Candidatus Bathyarchaeia archaeon]